MSGKPIMGLEIHVQLATESKLFCGCPTKAPQGEPNTACCEVCLGMPGSKPVLNKKAVDYGLMIALALNCEINREFYFSRKTYFYPDLAKDFQITQYEVPLAVNGYVELNSGKKIRITRVHLEEDPAALVHGEGLGKSAYSLVDYNRSGIPLAEIVTEPDIESAEEAREFLDHLLKILNYIGVYKLGEGVMKADSNVSIEGSERVEVKNVSGFRAVETALNYEVKRQQHMLSKGEKILRETRRFDEQKGSTMSLRKKETEADYGYIFDSDLTTVEIDGNMVKEARAKLPELHKDRAKRLAKEYRISDYDAKVISADLELGLLFEEAVKVDVKLATTFLTRELLAILNRENLSLKEAEVDSEKIIALMKLLKGGKVTEKNAKLALVKYIAEKKDPVKFIEKEGLAKDLRGGEVENAVETFLKENQKAADDYRSGNKTAMNFMVGQIMRLTKGKAEPREIQRLLEGKLDD